METKEYEVEVVYRQRAIYSVQAPDAEAAKRIATDRWQRGERSDVAGQDWCEMEFAHAEEEPDFKQQRQDDELVLRFLHEREKLLLQIGGGVFNPTMNDAISAAQVASDLGWRRPSGHPSGPADSRRASRTLERLCKKRKLICFERPRGRSGERGGIRLYCTPEYLERLSASVGVAEGQGGWGSRPPVALASHPAAWSPNSLQARSDRGSPAPRRQPRLEVALPVPPSSDRSAASRSGYSSCRRKPASRAPARIQHWITLHGCAVHRTTPALRGKDRSIIRSRAFLVGVPAKAGMARNSRAGDVGADGYYLNGR